MTTPHEPAEPKYSDARIEKIAARLDVLSTAVADGRKNEFTMRVPAEPDRDADLVLATSAAMLRHLLAERAASRPSTPDKAGVSDAQAYQACKVGRITRDEPSAGELNRMRQVLEHFATQSAEAVRDGERYRWLREQSGASVSIEQFDDDGDAAFVRGYSPEELDRIIDAALKEQSHD